MFLTMDAVSANRLSLDEKIRITLAASTVGGSSMHLRNGERGGQATAHRRCRCIRQYRHYGACPACGWQRATVRARHESKAKGWLNRTEFMNLHTARQRPPRDIASLTWPPAPTPAQNFTAPAFLPQEQTNGQYKEHAGSALCAASMALKQAGSGFRAGAILLCYVPARQYRILAVVMGGTSRNARDAMATRLIEAGFDGGGDPKKIRRARLLTLKKFKDSR